MTPEQDTIRRLIWATRGRSWGFRFLLDGGLPDPLANYEVMFAGLQDAPTLCRRVDRQVALRFPDPLKRRDAAGRVIPHEFVVSGDLTDAIKSVGDGLKLVWPLVAGTYARVWDAERPPSVSNLRFIS